MPKSIFPEGDDHPYNTQPETYVVPVVGDICWDESCRLTPSNRVVKALKASRLGIETTRFRRNVLSAIWEDALAQEFHDEKVKEKYVRRLKKWARKNSDKHIISRCEILDTWVNRDSRFIPDAYLIDKANKTVVCYEVEDSNPLNPRSIGEYCAAWWCLEYIYWDLHLIAYDIYGNWRIVNFPHSEFIAERIRNTRYLSSDFED